ncbi:MAG: beta-phosphoglucomutase [Sporolactobacillus sp.]|jgi:beta-phosphoglucomutase|nr:beta-phosphoglucomutase [Sporolactobacillus sp.]
MTSLQGVIFDLDGVITDTAEYHFQAWKKLADRIGISIDRTFNEQLKGVGRMASLERILRYGRKENDFSEAEKKKLTDWKNSEYVKMIRHITSSDLLPGVADFLAELKAARIKTAIASASKNAGTILRALGIKETFDYIVDASTVKQSKPNPEVFIRAYRGLQLPPSSCVGIEDAALGVDAILAAGMKAIGIGNRKILGRATLVLESTAELTLEKVRAVF